MELKVFFIMEDIYLKTYGCKVRPTCLTKFILRVSTQGMVRVVRLCRNEPDNNETIRGNVCGEYCVTSSAHTARGV